MQVSFLLGKLKELDGSATKPNSSDNRTIVVFCTADGEFEAIEANSDIAKTWIRAKDIYRGWWRGQLGFKLGELKVEDVLSDTQLAYLLSCVKTDDVVKFDTKSLTSAFEKLGKHCSLNKRNVHINKFGSDEEWVLVKGLIQEHLLKKGVNVFVYKQKGD